MNPRRCIVLAAACAAGLPSASALTITELGSPQVETFDSLAIAGSADILPSGWFFSESGTAANTTYAAGTGSGSTGNTYSFGAAGSADRALGSLRSGSLVPLFGVQLVNATGSVIDSLALAYTGEQWRLGTASRVDRLDVQYSLNASSLISGLWMDLDALDFVSPVTAGTTGALDGNNAANQVALAASLTGLGLDNGASLWLRWVDLDAAGADDGLAIDDFRVTARGLATPPVQAVPESLPAAGCLGVALLGLAMARCGLSTRGRATQPAPRIQPGAKASASSLR